RSLAPWETSVSISAFSFAWYCAMNLHFELGFAGYKGRLLFGLFRVDVFAEHFGLVSVDKRRDRFGDFKLAAERVYFFKRDNAGRRFNDSILLHREHALLAHYREYFVLGLVGQY